jgi:flagellin-specific chaperone FliS
MQRYVSLLLLLLPCGAFLISQFGFRPHRRNLPGRLCEAAPEQDKGNLDLIGTKASNLTTTIDQQALTLRQQAQAFRAEVQSLQRSLNESKASKLEKEMRNVDRWIDQLLVNFTVDENTQMLNNVDCVMELLRDGRFSQEQVNKIFKRICETGPAQSRSKCSPLMSLLVDAVGKLDEVDRADNPNKRWSGKVERELRKKLFFLDWGIEWEEEEQKSDRFL